MEPSVYPRPTDIESPVSWRPFLLDVIPYGLMVATFITDYEGFAALGILAWLALYPVLGIYGALSWLRADQRGRVVPLAFKICLALHLMQALLLAPILIH
jgi:hypothetical protein